MSETLKMLFAEAMRLSRDGRCTEATALIQRGLHLARPPAYVAHGRSARNPAHRTIAGDFEFVEDVAPSGGFIIHGRYSHGRDACDYRLYLPPSCSTSGRARALIVMLHGCQQDATVFARLTRMDHLADEGGFIVLYPSQARAANATGCWNWFLPEHRQPDHGEASLLAALAGEVAQRYAIHPKRCYAAGLSAGAAMALTLAAVQTGRFAAVGVHSGLPHGLAHDQMSALALMRQGPAAMGDIPVLPVAIPVIVFQGDADGRVNPRNAEAIIHQALGDLAGGGVQLRADTQDTHPEKGAACSVTSYRDPQGQLLAELWLVRGGGHGWFGGDPQMAFAEPQGPDASREMLRFFFAVSGIHHDE
ncbi:PHB depolymerase family esterase [Caldichromatium japonicum]|uniref:PHB depolymerase family esterase n=1 Tax=Caldichromatium japonicum TaxID=2699430 RepID=A0A6G7VCU1_9GAMM|nr:PHB depolymerase family esterase [Caldichromatium japonicum]QIK37607.1 PHB depolymerase family esterase [Caldichromatium japonicum]